MPTGKVLRISFRESASTTTWFRSMLSWPMVRAMMSGSPKQKEHQQHDPSARPSRRFVTEAVIRDIMARTIGQESIDLNQVRRRCRFPEAIPAGLCPSASRACRLHSSERAALTVAITEVFNRRKPWTSCDATLGQNVKIQNVACQARQARGLHRSVSYGHDVVGRRDLAARSRPGEIDYQSLQGGRRRVHHNRSCDWSVRCSWTPVKVALRTFHFRAEFAFLRIRYRIDGVCSSKCAQPAQELLGPGIRVRVKGGSAA